MNGTVAFLQNAWGPDPVRIAKYNVEMAALSVESYCEYISRRVGISWCLTHSRIQRAFGDDLNDITFSNSSRLAGTNHRARFSPDIPHMMAVLDHYRPAVVIAFGGVAREGITRCLEENDCPRDFRLLFSPHPAVRQKGIMDTLREVAESRRKALNIS